MFEFLKECNPESLYSRAHDCECTIKAFNNVTPIGIFMEMLLKLMYLEAYPELCTEDIDHMSMADIFRTVDFKEKIRIRYNFTDLDTVNYIIRKESNIMKHSVDAESLDAATVKKCFKCMFDCACCYYSRKTRKPAPKWSDEEYQKVLDNASDPEARKKVEELSSEIILLSRELKQTKSDKLQATSEVDRINNLLEEEKKKRIDPSILTPLMQQIDKLKEQIDFEEIQRCALEQKLRAAEEEKRIAEGNLLRTQSNTSELRAERKNLEEKFNRKSAIVDQLKLENSTLQEQIAKSNHDRIDLQVQLEKILSDSTDKKTCEQLEKSLSEAEKRQKAAENAYNSTASQLDQLQKKLFVANSRVDELSRKYQEAQKETEDLNKRRSELTVRNEELKARMQTADGPRCPLCNSILVPRRSQFDEGLFWACPGYRSDGNGCKYKTRRVTSHEMPMAKLLLPLSDAKSSNDKESFHLYNTIKEIRKTKFGLPSNELRKFKAKSVTFHAYPYSFEKSQVSAYLFQSVAVPDEIFAEKEELSVKLFSQFLLSCQMHREPVSLKDRTIYSLALRMLNRGIVLPISKYASGALRRKFNQKKCGSVNSLFNYITYSSPENPYGSDRERAFAEYYFPTVLGDSWATYVFSQIGFDALAPECAGAFANQRVDFLLSKNGKRIVIELDGTEHLAQTESDAMRDEFLRDHGYRILRFSNNAVDARDENILTQLKNEIGEDHTVAKLVEIDDRYLVACKLFHQFSIAIVKALEQGFISNHSNLVASANTDLFTKSEIQYILTLAVVEIQDILKNYAIIYDSYEEWDLSDKNANLVRICLGDGENMGLQSIILRDCYLQSDYLCDIAPFDQHIVPKKCDLNALEFFLQYLFGHDQFRPGQFGAIQRMVLHMDSIILLPTGAGKSVIYQLCSYIVPGIVIIISPLNSLIEDQISNLEIKSGINNAISIVSAQTEAEKGQRDEAIRIMKHNATSMLYISPERMQIPSFRGNVQSLLANNNIFAVAIDEAHCVSEWGHDFRPAYLNIGNSARLLFEKDGFVPALIALTGTASDAVLSDVQRDLKITGEDSLILPETFDRPELTYAVDQCASSDKTLHIADIIKNRLPKALDWNYEQFSRLNGDNTNAGIVFTPIASRKRPGEYDALSMQRHLSDILPEQGIACYFSKVPDGYDAETWKVTIQSNARKFKANEFNLLVATKAFGMGIDKNNIRYIIHDGIPSSFEQYYQEAGRAGRDRKKSLCTIVFSNDNAAENEELLNPALTLDDLMIKYADYTQKTSGKEDDLSSVMFFHSNSYKGVKKESGLLYQILDKIAEGEFVSGREVRIVMPIEMGQQKEMIERDWMQGMVRLSMLGIIKDYTYDYKCGFVVVLGSIGRDQIADNYLQYVSSYSAGRTESERAKLMQTKENGISFAKAAVHILIEYIYDNIEQSRRRAVREMFMTAKEASVLSDKEQDQFIRNRILSYFSYRNVKRDRLRDLITAENAGLLDFDKLFELSPDRESFSGEEIARATEMDVMIGRMLESMPDHPGLLLLQACAEIISGNYNESIVVNDIAAAMKFAEIRYSVRPDIIHSALCKTMNLALSSSVSLFDSAIEKVLKDETRIDCLSNFMSSKDFSDENRSYLLLRYISEKVNAPMTGV